MNDFGRKVRIDVQNYKKKSKCFEEPDLAKQF